MPTALLAMKDSNYFSIEMGHDSFDSDSLSGLHTAWLDDEQLNNLSTVDVFADESTPKAQNSSMDSGNVTEKGAAFNAALKDHDAQLLDEALNFSFDTDLSPILEPFAAMSPLRMQTRQSPRIYRTTSGPLRTVPLALNKRPRTRSSSWLEQEKNTFYSMFKVKWPQGEPFPPFSSLLLQRFDAISTKIRTKSVMEVRQLYNSVMWNISDMLQLVDNDINLTNPDQVRIAVWCWRKLMTDKKFYEEFQTLDSKPESVKNRLANVLLQSIIRSRRQMLKAKSDHMYNSASNTTDGTSLSSISAWVSRSNLSSFFAKGNIPVLETSVQIHHPMVRKKYPDSQVQSPGGAVLKRKRSESPTSEFVPEKKSRINEMEAATFTSPPPTDKRSRSCRQNSVAFHTPQQFSRKKIYIKMRMVPRDKQTKSDVVKCGCRPKVELKLSSTKKISEITAHMSKKWAKVRSLLPKEAVLCFYQKNGTDNLSKDSNVTCFDIWKRCGKQIDGENVVEVSYVWKVTEQNAAIAECENVQMQKLMPLRAPVGLFEQEVSAAKELLCSGDESDRSISQLSPAHGLQVFGIQVAFDRSVTTKAKTETAALEELISDSGDEDSGEEFSPATGRLRRRIQPVLVSKEEFDI